MTQANITAWVERAYEQFWTTFQDRVVRQGMGQIEAMGMAAVETANGDDLEWLPQVVLLARA